MVRVSIGGIERDVHDAKVPWLREHVEPARARGETVCVRVVIKASDIDMALSTPDCPSAGGGRRPRPKEQELFDLWEKHGLNSNSFSIGQLNAFLEHVKNL